MLAISVAFMALALPVISSLTPQYQAKTQIILDPPRSRNAATVETLVPELGAGALALETEIQVISAVEIAESVITELELDKRAEFNPAMARQEAMLREPGPVERTLSWITALLPASLLPEHGEEEQVAAEERDHADRMTMLNRFADALFVAPVGRSRVLQITFKSSDPKIAAAAANAVANRYLVQQLEGKLKAAQHTATWLNKRVLELRREAEESQRAVKGFVANSEIIQGRDVAMLRQQVIDLNRSFVVAQADYDTARARLAQAEGLVKKGNISGLIELSETRTLSLLQQQLSTLNQRQADFAGRLGPQHPEMQAVKAEVDAVRRDIQAEAAQIAAQARHETDAAAQRADYLKAAIDKILRELRNVEQAGAAMLSMESDAKVNLALYESFLNLAKETEHQTIEQPDAWVVTRALVPVAPYAPNKPILAVVAALIAGTLAIFVVTVVEIAQNGVRSTEEVERIFAANGLGLVPRVSRRNGRHNRIVSHLIANPKTAYAEALNTVYINIQLSSRQASRAIVLLVTSSQPNEGKSTLVASMATVLRRSGHKVAVVDTDLRASTQHTLFGLDNQIGLSSGIVRGERAGELVQIDERSGVHVYVAGPRIDNPLNLFRSVPFESFLGELRQAYDVVLIDSPPILAVADARVLALRTDATILVARWKKTRRGKIDYALRQLEMTNCTISGIVLTQVNTREHSHYGYGDSGLYHGKSKKYYTT
jgi:capsular exopolysaccharide synthesis family protein